MKYSEVLHNIESAKKKTIYAAAVDAHGFYSPKGHILFEDKEQCEEFIKLNNTERDTDYLEFVEYELILK